MIPFDSQNTEGNPGGSALLDRILERLSTTLSSLTKAVTNDRLVSVVFPSASTDVQVFHGLKGAPVSWEVVDKTADVNVWRSSTLNDRPRETIILQASADVTVLVRFA